MRFSKVAVSGIPLKFDPGLESLIIVEPSVDTDHSSSSVFGKYICCGLPSVSYSTTSHWVGGGWTVPVMGVVEMAISDSGSFNK